MSGFACELARSYDKYNVLHLPTDAPYEEVGCAVRFIQSRVASREASELGPSRISTLQALAADALHELNGSDGHTGIPASARAIAEAAISAVEDADLTAPVADVISAGLSIVAAALPHDSTNDTISDSWAVDEIERVAEELDIMALEIYRGLGRLEAKALAATNEDVLSHGHWASMELFVSYQRLGTWVLAVLARAVGSGRLTASCLWEWADGPLNQDAFSIMVLAKALLSTRSGEVLPQNLEELQTVVLAAVCGLADPGVAFCRDVGDSDSIEARNEALELHRARVTAAFAECNLLEVCLTFIQRPAPSYPLERSVQLLVGFIATLSGGESCEFNSPRSFLIRQLVKHSDDLWGTVTSPEIACPCTAMFLGNCSIIAIHAPPGDDACCALLQQACPSAGCELLAPAVILASSMAWGPEDTNAAHIIGLLRASSPDEKARVARALQRGRRKIAEDFHSTIDAWMAVLANPLAVEEQTLDAAQPQTANVPTSVQSGLQAAVADAPSEFRCQLDDKLLVDPVRTPQGLTCERWSLSKALAANGGVCPLSGVPLRIDECVRDADLRMKIVKWVRQTQPREPRKNGGAAKRALVAAAAAPLEPTEDEVVASFFA